jgi:hypothetical protein
MAGQQCRALRPEGEPGQDFDGAVGDPEVVAEAWATWRSEVEFAERFVAETDDLGSSARRATSSATSWCT